MVVTRVPLDGARKEERGMKLEQFVSGLDAALDGAEKEASMTKRRWCHKHGWVMTHPIHSDCPVCGAVTVNRPDERGS